MRLDDTTVLTGMAYDRKKVAQIVTGLEDAINTHLVKLLALEADDATRAHWKRELRSWFRKLSVLRIKPDNAMPSAAWMFEMLFTEPFEGVAETNVTSLIALLRQDGYRSRPREASETVAALRVFHQTMAGRLAAGDAGEDLIAAL